MGDNKSTEESGWRAMITFSDVAEPMLVWYETEKELQAFVEGFTIGRFSGLRVSALALYSPAQPFEVKDFTTANEGEGNEPGQEG
jgi:hypothetical protein